ncbi:hypothetical protein N8301_01825 [Cyclobacteriaceae bacterium]|nr:hypothetical protein [Cyclobacteriaceae bacterium]
MELDITVIGIGLIVLILLIDLIMSGLKKKTKKTDIEIITEEKIGKKSRNDIFSYIINRKRNIVSVILVTMILKVLIHFFVFPEMVKTQILNPIAGKMVQRRAQGNFIDVMRPATIGYHVERTLTTRLDLFAYSFGGLLVVVFLFNDKIKAR